jgi:predicted Fe-S protein YdhL (DUF1289 family)
MKSSCVNICTLDSMGKYCVGCGRTISQIMEAGNATYPIRPSPKTKKN